MSEKHTGESRGEAATVRLGFRASFARIEAKARELLRERGFSEAEIDTELNRSKGDELISVSSLGESDAAATPEQHSN